jgi:hypothetical protein
MKEHNQMVAGAVWPFDHAGRHQLADAETSNAQGQVVDWRRGKESLESVVLGKDG